MLGLYLLKLGDNWKVNDKHTETQVFNNARRRKFKARICTFSMENEPVSPYILNPAGADSPSKSRGRPEFGNSPGFLGDRHTLLLKHNDFNRVSSSYLISKSFPLAPPPPSRCP